MSDGLVKKFERKGPLATYDLIAALDRNPTIIGAGADICAEAKSTIFAQAARIEELEAKLAKAVDALHVVTVKRRAARLDDAKFVARTTLAELTGASHE